LNTDKTYWIMLDYWWFL